MHVLFYFSVSLSNKLKALVTNKADPNASSSKLTVQSSTVVTKTESTKNVFKFCNISETDLKEDKSSVSNGDKRTESPSLFEGDTQDSEQGDIESRQQKKHQHPYANAGETEKKSVEKPSSAIASTKKKPLFRQKIETITEDPTVQQTTSRSKMEDMFDFKYVNRNRSMSSVTPQLNKNDESIEQDGEGLKTKRSRGVKRKSLSRKENAKKSRGVDFIDNIETSKENQVCELINRQKNNQNVN